MIPVECAMLVMAKAPVAGQAKTRLTSTYSPEVAAELAAAALLDTLDAVRCTPASARIVALTGDLSRSNRGEVIASALSQFTIIDQRGDEFAMRLVEAHRDAAAIAGCPVLQIGMDTPQVTPELLAEAAATLVAPDVDAVLGMATDGGWWALGVSGPDTASVLADVSMSRSDTGARTLDALRNSGCRVSELMTLTDVDTSDDVWRVAETLAVDSHFRCAAERHCSLTR